MTVEVIDCHLLDAVVWTLCHVDAIDVLMLFAVETTLDRIALNFCVAVVCILVYVAIVLALRLFHAVETLVRTFAADAVASDLIFCHDSLTDCLADAHADAVSAFTFVHAVLTA